MHINPLDKDDIICHEWIFEISFISKMLWDKSFFIQMVPWCKEESIMLAF